MDISLIVIAAIAAVLVVALVILQVRAGHVAGELTRRTSEVADLATRHAAEVAEIRESVVRLSTRMENAQQTIEELNNTIADLEAENVQLLKTRTDAENREALAMQKVEENERRM